MEKALALDVSLQTIWIYSVIDSNGSAILTGVTIVGALAALVAAGAALIGLVKPKLYVADMTLSGHFQTNFIGDVRKEQEAHRGEEPTYILRISIRNSRNVTASRVSGRILIAGALQPLNYPGYTKTHIRAPITGFEHVKVVKVLASDQNRVPPKSSGEALLLEIPILLEGYDNSTLETLSESFRKRVNIAYRFFPEQGKLIEGEWILRMAVGRPEKSDFPPDHGPVPKSERKLHFPPNAP